jgi:integrase
MSTPKSAGFGHIRRLPSGRWQASYRMQGKRYTAPAGTFSTERAARKWLEQVDAQRVLGQWQPPKPPAPFFVDYFEAVMTRREHELKVSTRDLYREQYRLHLGPRWGNERIDDITAREVEVWLQGLRRTSGPTLARQVYSLLRMVMNRAVKDGLLSVNPVIVEGAGAEPQRQEKNVPTMADFLRMAEAADPRWRALCYLLGASGGRIGEALALTRDDVDLEAGTVSLLKGIAYLSGTREIIVQTPKSKARVLALPRVAVEALRIHLSEHTEDKGSDLLWPTLKGPRAGLPIHEGTAYAALSRACNAAGLPVIGPHRLRHFALTQAASTAGLADVMHRGGHSTIEAASRYQHSTAQAQRAITDGFELEAQQVAEVIDLASLRRMKAGA